MIGLRSPAFGSRGWICDPLFVHVGLIADP